MANKTLEIIPGVYCLDLGVSNCYIILEEDQITLIDAGVKRSFDWIHSFLRSLDRSPENLTHILLTHADLDHVGAASALKEDSDVKVYASHVAADALAVGRSSRKVKMGIFTPIFSWFERQGGAMKVEVDEILSPGDVLPILGGLEVLETPGHTPGHISFYAREHKLLFAGDSVSTQEGSVLYNRMKSFNWDNDLMQTSVHEQEALQPEIVCSGHGPVVFGAAGKFPKKVEGK
ncbi:MAG: MBL fold metallo-hydrolase [Anaerolineales bacterium]|jgi:glyoxylase-like metal-dependent hydrolase (beta-lactamase superfamily II)